jgi:fibronectin type 3 domain-containing protein
VDVTVRPADTAGVEGVESDPAELGTGDAPAPPEDLSASASQAIGPGKILLTWTANTEDDLAWYRLYRTDGVEPYEQVTTISSTTFPLMYTDDNDEELLAAGVEYTYYVTAVDEDDFESPPSNEASTTAFFPAAPTTPTMIDASDDIPYSYSIQVTWGESESDYLDGYEVWRKGPGEAEFSLWTPADTSTTTLLDSGLSEGETYSYKARAFDTFEQYSDFTGEASSVPSVYVPMEIYSVTTDKTTLQVNSTERAHLEVDLSNPGADITWEATAGSFEGGDTGLTVTYAPPTSGDAQKVTVTVTANDGVGEEEADLELIITTLELLGPAIDFSLPSWAAPDAPYKAFSEWYDDRCVIQLDMGGHW